MSASAYGRAFSCSSFRRSSSSFSFSCSSSCFSQKIFSSRDGIASAYSSSIFRSNRSLPENTVFSFQSFSCRAHASSIAALRAIFRSISANRAFSSSSSGQLTCTLEPWTASPSRSRTDDASAPAESPSIFTWDTPAGSSAVPFVFTVHPLRNTETA